MTTEKEMILGIPSPISRRGIQGEVKDGLQNAENFPDLFIDYQCIDG